MIVRRTPVVKRPAAFVFYEKNQRIILFIIDLNLKRGDNDMSVSLNNNPKDWGEVSETYDNIKKQIATKDLASDSEAQTRFDIIDRIIREVLYWQHGQISVEENSDGRNKGYVDYILRAGDYVIVIEAKKVGSTFPNPTKKKKLKLSGSILSSGEISKAIEQVDEYAIIKAAKVAIVTNGTCWCYYVPEDKDEDAYATIRFPFTDPHDAEQLFDLFASFNVLKGSLDGITNNRIHSIENRLLSEVNDSDSRVDRNNIADHIAPALDGALYAEALLNNPENLKRCYVATEARVKFDTMLGVHFADIKPITVEKAKRIKRDQKPSILNEYVSNAGPGFAPPVTLIIGTVGSGKSTYLKHFELVSGSETLERKNVHWIYIDFEKLGKKGNPRQFIYNKLRDYLLADHPNNPTDYKNCIEPTYQPEIMALAKGPYALIAGDKTEFKKFVTGYIDKDLQAIEPFVDKTLGYLSKKNVCIVVLDNIDLYEDEELETQVFSEGLALSKRIFCHVIVSIRDKTYVRHRNDSAFDAYELRKLWLDPPPFNSVLSKRLTYSKHLLKGKPAKVLLENGSHLMVPDLSVFFEIVHKSILNETAGRFIESMSDTNIRKGLALVTNFLTSGHIQADKAIRDYLIGNQSFSFPFHEIFKGTMLGQWKYYREDRSECTNIFDSRIGAKNSRLLRLYILQLLRINARNEQSIEVPVLECIRLFTRIGCSESQIVHTLNSLYKLGLLRNTTAEEIDSNSSIVLTKCGGYYISSLCKKFVYVETCLFDTAIEDGKAWHEITSLTSYIEYETNIAKRMISRKQRIEVFLNYLTQLEQTVISLLGEEKDLNIMSSISDVTLKDVEYAIKRSEVYS